MQRGDLSGNGKWKIDIMISTHIAVRGMTEPLNIYTSPSPVTVSKCCPQCFESRDVSR